MNAVADVGTARAALVEKLQHALDALEQGDEAGWRQELDAIAAWRTQPMMQGLGRLARELAQTLGELPPTDAGELDDACARLDHVVEMTEQASHTTLDLAEQCRGYATQLKGTDLSPEQAALVDRIGKGLSEMALAQSYQDLTGQIIQRVIQLIRSLQSGLGDIQALHGEDSKGNGPAVSGVDPPAATQDEANDLLADLGI